jgi:hypothetical protein
MLCESFPGLQVALLATMPFPDPTSLSGQYFPILPPSVVLEVLFVLASKPGWLALCLLELVKCELRLNQRSGVIVWAHRLFLMFRLSWVL